MPKLKNQVPKYRRHKASGQAVVTLHGRDHYLGEHGGEESQKKYEQLISRWLANRNQPSVPTLSSDASPALTINELLVAYWEFARSYYVKGGTQTGELTNMKEAMRPLAKLYGEEQAEAFGPVALKAVRQTMLDADLSRKVINSRVNRIKRVFKWGVENQLVQSQVLLALQSVSPLKKGRCGARETLPIKPVSEEYVDAVEPFVSRQVWAMIELQSLTGMRPGEVAMMRACDIDTTGRLWLYTPASHKTEHHNYERVIYFGPKAQQMLKPFLKPDVEAYLFSPVEADEVWRRERRRNRKTPLSCGNRPGTTKKRRPKRKPGEHYTPNSYLQAVQRACDRAFPPPEHLAKKKNETVKEWRARLTIEEKNKLKDWRKQHRWHPNQLRHNAATRLRKEFGLEVARIILGHHSAAITELYAERDLAVAADIMMKIG